MTTELTVQVIKANDVDAIPPLDSMQQTPIQAWFAEATAGSLRMTMRQQVSGHVSNPIDGGGLQEILSEYVPTPANPQIVDTIGLVFCRQWIGGDLAGLMFDYDGADLPSFANISYKGVPRLGCAVFLDPLAERSNAEKIYAAMHELGHIFNFLHDPTNSSFMGLQSTKRAFTPTDS